MKDRKGRVLVFNSVSNYTEVIKALLETDRIMKEIDEVVGIRFEILYLIVKKGGS